MEVNEKCPDCGSTNILRVETYIITKYYDIKTEEEVKQVCEDTYVGYECDDCGCEWC